MLLLLCVVAWLAVAGHCRLNGSIALTHGSLTINDALGLRSMQDDLMTSVGGPSAQHTDYPKNPKTSVGGPGAKSDDGDSAILRCHYFNSDSIKGVLVPDIVVKCDTSVRFCYKLVKTVGKETTTFKGCDGDPVYGLTVDGELTSFCLIDGPVIKKTGTTETNLNCCDTTGCNSASRFVFGFSSVLAIYVITTLL